ncbi:hypothetical protein C0992_001310 [Termitomyces sp. T32_za158]|nr:hypothetical protein C0992_001310 [Termitomyces sp. T32_za158]
MGLIGLGLLYFIAGTLYNRYVLHLQGFDQIPRFSIESMRYHASETADWFKDLVGLGTKKYNYRMPEEGLSTPFSGENVLSRSAQGTGGLNPISHHTQASRPENAGTGPSLGGGAFVRPYIAHTTSPSGKKPDINPISHQVQAVVTSTVSAPSTDLPQSQPPPQSQSQPQPQQARSPPLAAPSANPEPAPVKERHRPQPFDLGDDDDGEVHLDNTTSAVIPQRQVGAAAQERGRDLGNGGVIRL